MNDAPQVRTTATIRTGLPKVYPGYLFIAPVILYLAVFAIYPVINILVMSFQDVQAGTWVWAGFKHFIRAARDPVLLNAMLNTAWFTLASTVFHLVIGMVFALLLNEHWFSNNLRNVFRGALIVPWVFSTAAAGLMWSLLYHPFGLINYIASTWLGVQEPLAFLADPKTAMWAVIVVNTWKSYPFYMVSILGGLQSIPSELYEAARVDGAGAWHRFVHITLPQLRPVLVAITTIDVISTFGHVDLVAMLTSGGPGRSTETVAYLVFKTALQDGNLPYGSALSAITLVILSAFTFFYLRASYRKESEAW